MALQNHPDIQTGYIDTERLNFIENDNIAGYMYMENGEWVINPPLGSSGTASLTLSDVLNNGNTLSSGQSIDASNGEVTTQVLRVGQIEPILPILNKTIGINANIGIGGTGYIVFENDIILKNNGSTGVYIDSVPQASVSPGYVLGYNPVTKSVTYIPESGSIGPTGADGVAGPTGADGVAGPTGADGVAGPTGFISAIGSYNGDYVRWDGSSWVSGGSNINIGQDTGQTEQSENTIAIGNYAGNDGQSSNSIAIGNNAGTLGQKSSCIAIGNNAGRISQSGRGVAIGTTAGYESQGLNAIAIGSSAASGNQGVGAVAIGNLAGSSSQGVGAVAIGNGSGYSNQGSNAVAIGRSAGNSSQSSNSVALGNNAGSSSQGVSAVALGNYAGNDGQLSNSIALGNYAGAFEQNSNSIALGNYAGTFEQNSNSIAIGNYAGTTGQGSNAIAIGYLAGNTSQKNNTIVLNASGVALNGDGNTGALYIDPIRTDNTTPGYLSYNTGTKEVVYNNSPGTTGPQASVFSLTSNIGNTGAIDYTLDCGTLSDNYGGFTGTLSYTGGVFTNTSTKPISLLVDFELDAEQGNWDVGIYKNTTQIWQSQIIGTYNRNSFSQALVMNGGDTGSVRYNISGPTGYTLNAANTKIQFTRLDAATGAKTFVIDHPEDSLNKYLVHACLEGPEAGVYYRGKSVIGESGEVSIRLPSYVSKLADELTVHITPIHVKGLVRTKLIEASEVFDNQFMVYGDPGPFNWIVYGRRSILATEPYKTQVYVSGQGPYRFIQ